MRHRRNRRKAAPGHPRPRSQELIGRHCPPRPRRPRRLLLPRGTCALGHTRLAILGSSRRQATNPCWTRQQAMPSFSMARYIISLTAQGLRGRWLPLSLALRHGGDSGAVPQARHRLPAFPARHVRLRDLGRKSNNAFFSPVIASAKSLSTTPYRRKVSPSARKSIHSPATPGPTASSMSRRSISFFTSNTSPHHLVSIREFASCLRRISACSMNPACISSPTGISTTATSWKSLKRMPSMLSRKNLEKR